MTVTEIELARKDEVDSLESDFENHSDRHEDGGADEISVDGLSGVLADDQPPQSHDNDAHDVDFALDSDLSDHVDDTGNPHETTLEQARSEDNTLSGNINFSGNDASNVGSIDADEGTYADKLSVPEPAGAGDIESGDVGFFVVTDEDRVIYRYED